MCDEEDWTEEEWRNNCSIDSDMPPIADKIFFFY